ncbi:MAG: DUF3232 domain-containing protein [Nanoarchaeota archaeon]|nr:DUF3232 domain-containing protein [Nanoarchaeota archaeon]MBU1632705.1 DUF3232 domain-containing protein [Nanoarchaeota archaeon]MBU1876281.1 DUF3232 domain-containing protein [Nanoarchaeota archaeon]
MVLEDTVEAYRKIYPTNAKPNDNYQNAYARFTQVKDFLEDNEDKKGLSLIEELLTKAISYIDCIVRMDISNTVRFRLEEEEMINKLVELDHLRRIKHEALISQLNITNRYLFKNYEVDNDIPAGRVYSLPPETIRDRVSVGDWAGYLITGLYENRDR